MNNSSDRGDEIIHVMLSNIIREVSEQVWGVGGGWRR